MNEILIALISGLTSLFIGGGGVFAYLNAKNKLKHEERESAVHEWKELYDEMKERLDEQQNENIHLREEVAKLKQTINELAIDLQNYKKYDSYIFELEKYVDHLLHTVKSAFSEDAYKNICNKRPIKTINKNGDK